MSLFLVDIEADGPAPGLYSMVSFGVVAFDKHAIGETYYGKVAPITPDFIPDALAISGFSRRDHETFDDPSVVLPDFVQWLAKHNTKGRPVFVSDNPAFDWQFMNYYLWKYTNSNPFGHSARRIGDFYAGLQGDFFSRANWRAFKKTPHTHNPVDDAKGNAEAMMVLLNMKR